MRIFRTLALAATLLGAAAAAGASETFKIDAEHASVGFAVSHLGYSNMMGRFGTVAGSFVLNEANPAASSVAVEIDAASIDTNHAKRDAHLKSPDFFNVAEFPTLTFKSTRIEPTGEKTAKVTGELTLLGVTKPVVLDVTFNRKAPHPLPQYKGVLVAGFSATGTLKRSDFGMSYALPGVGDEVRLFLEIEGHKS